MPIRTRDFTRRGLLRSAAAGLALAPFLPVFGREAEDTPIRRVLFFNSGHGLAYYDWKPSGTEWDWELTPVLEPLAAFKDRTTVIGGLSHPAAELPKHADGIKSILTGSTPIGPEGNRKPASISIDQYLAQQIGGDVPHSSLASGVHTSDAGLMALGAEQQLSAERSPSAQFERVFGDLDLDDEELQRLKAERGSVIDHVREDLAVVQGIVGAEDRIKIERHLDGIRTLELELEHLGELPGACTVPDDPGVPGGDSYPAVARAHMDVLAAALTCGVTRVGLLTFDSSNANSGSFIGTSKGLHEIAHEGSSANKPGASTFRDLSIWHAQQVAYMLERLDEVPEGDGTVLDHTLVVWFTFLRSGHFWDDMPITLFGGGASGLQTGRFLEYAAHRTTNDLWLSVAQRMGAPMDTFGDPGFCNGPLPGLV